MMVMQVIRNVQKRVQKSVPVISPIVTVQNQFIVSTFDWSLSQKSPTPNFFNFPEKKLNFTIENLDNNGNEYIYISVPLVAFKELPDYIKGNANYQFESHPVLYYKLPRGRKMSCFKPNENLAELIREIIQHREESHNDLDLNQTTVASLLWP